MPVAYESDGGGVFAAANNNNAITVPLPAIRPVGSIFLLAAFCRLITAAAPTISGYTLLNTWTSGTASGGRMWLYGRIVDGSEAAPSVTPVGATGTTGDIFGAGIVCYSGVDTSGGITAIFDGTPTTTDTSGTTTNTYPALTISQSNSMIVRFLSRYRDAIETFTPTATWNERADLASTARTGGQFHMQDKLATTAGVQAAVTVAPSVTSSGRYLAVSLALKAIPAQTYFGSLSQEITFAASITGDVSTPAQTYYGSLAMPLAFEAAVDGRRQTFGQFELPIILSKETEGQRKTFGQLLSPFIFGKTVSGQRKTFGQIAFPISVAIATAGFRAGLTLYGAIALPITFDKDIRGQRKAFGQVGLPLTFSKDVRGQRKTFGQIALPIIFTKEAVGRKNVFGQLSMQTLFGKEVSGWRKTFGQLALSMTFSKSVAGRRKTFGLIAVPIGFTAFVNGQVTVGPKTLYGQLAMPLVFSKQVEARRKTFGKTNSPFIFGSASQGLRHTFGKFDLPLEFEAMTKSGRITTYGALDLDLVFMRNTTGYIIVKVTLNDALDLYLGEQEALAVYIGNEKVWP